MKEDTFTYTARSTNDPNKMAMFTLHNGNVSVDMGNALMERVGEAHDTFSDEETDSNLTTWIRPAATGAIQKLAKPVPLADFDAEMSEDGGLRATAWLRAGGLRLAPIMMTWSEVDNPEGAQAFVTELRNRKESVQHKPTQPSPLDYWLSWIAIGFVVTIALPILFIRQWQKRRSS